MFVAAIAKRAQGAPHFARGLRERFRVFSFEFTRFGEEFRAEPGGCFLFRFKGFREDVAELRGEFDRSRGGVSGDEEGIFDEVVEVGFLVRVLLSR